MSNDQITGTPSSVVLSGTDTYSDPVTIASDATVTGQPAVTAADTRGIQNDGTVAGTNTGIDLLQGGSVTNIAGATITGFKYGVVGAVGGAAPTDIINQGYIGATSPQHSFSPHAWGVYLGAGGSITNASTGTITGYDGINIQGAYGSIDNAGKISTYDKGISFGKQGGAITNEATGTINGYRNFGISIQGPGTVDNSGLIEATGYAPQAAIQLMSAGTVINHVNGTITGDANGSPAGDGVSIINYYADPGTPSLVDNFGTISGFYGVYFDYGVNGTLINESTGSIFGDRYGVLMNDVGTVINSGTITAGYSSGVRLRDDGTVINKAGGTIIGGTYSGSRGVQISGSNATLENAGTIIATMADAVDLSASGTNRLIVDAGAVFDGKVVAKSGATNTLELSGTYGAGTISGIGTQFQHFQTVAIDAGATWTVAGTIAGFHGSTIQGFDTSDRLDLTNLTYSADNTFSLSNTDLLTISENGTAVASIQLSGDFSGEFFHLTNDGHGGSYITEDNSPACYCRGTLILTDRGQVAVEDLEIGDRLITASGEAMKLRWIGRRSYRGWAAKYNDQVQPIRFTAGSIAKGIPARDLLVSPEHAMFLDGVLIPARHLVNGVSVLKSTGMDDIQYFHLELDTHAVIVAEGALSESFIDDNSRSIFHNADEYRKLYPNAPRPLFAQFCAPRVEDGAVLETARDRITARYTASTIRMSRSAEPGPSTRSASA